MHFFSFSFYDFPFVGYGNFKFRRYATCSPHTAHTHRPTLDSSNEKTYRQDTDIDVEGHRMHHPLICYSDAVFFVCCTAKIHLQHLLGLVIRFVVRLLCSLEMAVDCFVVYFTPFPCNASPIFPCAISGESATGSRTSSEIYMQRDSRHCTSESYSLNHTNYHIRSHDVRLICQTQTGYAVVSCFFFIFCRYSFLMPNVYYFFRS